MNVPDMLEKAAQKRLEELEGIHRRRRLSIIPQGFDDFSSNDYLGLKRHPSLIETAIDWTRRFGVGSGASRLAGGTKEEYLRVETKLAQFKRQEAALIFNSGFQLNATIIPALVELYDPAIFADRLIHRSLHDGIALSQKKQNRFRHNDLNHLKDLLKKEAAPHKLIVTESIFSMDGDAAPLKELLVLAHQYGATLYIDEAHATGLFGEEGRGLATGLDGDVIVMGTLGKALGAFGAYIAGPKLLIDYFINRASGFIYSTALPPSCYGVLDRALDLVPVMDKERLLVQDCAARLRNELRDKGIATGNSISQIVPGILGEEENLMAAQAHFAENKIFVPAIRPPTVPTGSARLRFSLNASHTDQMIEHLFDIIRGL